MFNRGGHRPRPLTALEQLIMDYVWEHPDCTADTCRTGIASKRSLKDSTIRTILRNLEEKGYVTHTVQGRTFVYSAKDSRRNVAVQAVQQLIDRFCGGSLQELLVGLVEARVLDKTELENLEAFVRSRKKGGR